MNARNRGKGNKPAGSAAPRAGRRRLLPLSIAPSPTGERARDAEGVTAPAAEIGACAIELSSLRARLGIAEPPAAVAAPPDADPLSVPIGEVYVRSLPAAPEVSRATGVTADHLLTLLAQHSEFVRLLETVDQLGADLGDSRAIVGLVQGRAVRRVLRKVRAVLADPSVPLGVREKLQSDAAEFLRLGAAAEEQRRARRKKTLAHRQKTSAELSAKERRKRLLDAMLALRQGEDVPKEVLAEASRTYDEILGQGRRDRDR